MPIVHSRLSKPAAMLLALAAVVGLGACNPGVANPSFTITLLPPVLNFRVTETGVVKVVVNRADGFAAPVTITVQGDTTGLEIAALSIEGNQGDLAFLATDDATIGTTHVVVTATAEGLVGGAVLEPRTETLTLHIAKAIAGVTEVTIPGNGGSTQVRQGFGPVTVEITGRNFERVTELSLGNLVVAVTEQTADRLVLSTVIPHGTTIGGKNLVLTAEGGDFTQAAALIVTAITAGPAGDDTTGSGTTDAPFRTLTHALSISQAGDTVRLLNGVYSAAAGELWPLLGFDGPEPGPNVPVGVSVQGESRAGAIIEGPGWPTLGDYPLALAFAGDGAATSVTIRGFAAALYVNTGSVHIADLLADESLLGLGVYGGETEVVDAEFAFNNIGVVAVGEAVVNITGGSSHDNADSGLLAYGGSPVVTATGFTAFGNYFGVSVSDEATAELEAVTLHDNLAYGLQGRELAAVTLVDSEVYANEFGGVEFGGGTLRMRGTTLRNNPGFGLYVLGQPSRIDLGTFVEPGNNVLANNAEFEGTPGGDQLLDVRNDRAPVTIGEEIAFTVSATTFNGVTPAADVYPGNGLWPYLNSPMFSIFGLNNVIQFY